MVPPPAPDPALDALRAEVLALRAQLGALDADLRRAQAHVDLTMRNQLRCRACGCRRIAHAPSVLDRGDNDSREDMALFKPSWWRSATQGELEVYACTGCGLVEWWVKDPGSLEPHDGYLRILDGEPPADPYR